MGPSPVRALRWEWRGGFWGALGEREPAPHFLRPGAHPSLFLTFPTGMINANYTPGAAGVGNSEPRGPQPDLGVPHTEGTAPG